VFRVVQPNGNTKHSTNKLHTHTHAKTGPLKCMCVLQMQLVKKMIYK